MNIGIGTTDPQFTVQAVQDGKEILRITDAGKATPGEGLTVHEAVMAMCEMIRREERERILKAIKKHDFYATEGCQEQMQPRIVAVVEGKS